MREQDPRRPPVEVAALRAGLRAFLDAPAADGRPVGSSKYGIYVFYDYDGEPIYVGQTSEQLRVRIQRHLTNQRTDAVAMNVLDPFEVAEIEVWPFEIEDASQAPSILNQAEYTVFQKVLAESAFGAVLNEGQITPTDFIPLPPSYRNKIIPDDVYELRKHPDTRIARRASTIANLARVISEREVSRGLRMTLLTQARRLESLASKRLGDLGIPDPKSTAGQLEAKSEEDI